MTDDQNITDNNTNTKNEPKDQTNQVDKLKIDLEQPVAVPQKTTEQINAEKLIQSGLIDESSPTNDAFYNANIHKSKKQKFKDAVRDGRVEAEIQEQEDETPDSSSQGLTGNEAVAGAKQKRSEAGNEEKEKQKEQEPKNKTDDTEGKDGENSDENANDTEGEDSDESANNNEGEDSDESANNTDGEDSDVPEPSTKQADPDKVAQDEKVPEPRYADPLGGETTGDIDHQKALKRQLDKQRTIDQQRQQQQQDELQDFRDKKKMEREGIDPEDSDNSAGNDSSTQAEKPSGEKKSLRESATQKAQSMKQKAKAMKRQLKTVRDRSTKENAKVLANKAKAAAAGKAKKMKAGMKQKSNDCFERMNPLNKFKSCLPTYNFNFSCSISEWFTKLGGKMGRILLLVIKLLRGCQMCCSACSCCIGPFLPAILIILGALLAGAAIANVLGADFIKIF